jgi:ABC-type lipoprotein export system ATPase subunit
MSEIIIDHILPDFFTTVERRESNVWGQRLTFEEGRFYAVSAASGKGKSTLLNYIFGIRKIPNGDVLLNGRSVSTWSADERSNMRSTSLSMVFQDLQLFGHLSARENIALKLARSNESTWEEVENWARQMEVFDLLDRRCDRLSLGQQQRIAILRALSQPFEWLLMDEPTSHLDEHNAQRVIKLVQEECKRRAAGCIVSTLERVPFFEVDQTVYC